MSLNEVIVNPLAVTTIIEILSPEFNAVSMTTELSTVDEEECCRICHSRSEEEELISPCKCSGSLRFVHHSCLNIWLNMPAKSNKKQCELCKFDYLFKIEPKSFLEWKKLALTLPERQKLVCLIVITLLMFITVISTAAALLPMFLDKVKHQDQEIDLTFMIKTGIICFLFSGSLYIIGHQCRMVLTYFYRWRDSNQIVFVSDISQTTPK